MIINFQFDTIYLRKSNNYEECIELLFVSKLDLNKYYFFDGIEFKLIKAKFDIDLTLWEDISTILDPLKSNNINITSITEDKYGEISIELNHLATLNIISKLDFKEEITQQVFLKI